MNKIDRKDRLREIKTVTASRSEGNGVLVVVWCGGRVK